MAKTYDASSIVVLKPLEAVRKRPGMYVGSADTRGMHLLVHEVLLNAAFAGIGQDSLHIFITLHPDGSVSVADNGPGFPDTTRGDGNKQRVFANEALMQLFAGGRYGNPYGIGLAVVNALSESLVLESSTGGKAFAAKCERGELTEPWHCTGVASASGTRVTLKPDANIFGNISLELHRILSLCHERARLQENVRFVVIDRSTEPGTETSISVRGGMVRVVEEFAVGLQVYPSRLFHLPPVFPLAAITQPAVHAAALAFTKRSFARVGSFVNFTPSPDGGSHVLGFHAAVDEAFSLANVPRAARPALRRGMLGAIHVVHPDPRWEGCVRSRINAPELVDVVRMALAPQIADWIAECTTFSKAMESRALPFDVGRG